MHAVAESLVAGRFALGDRIGSGGMGVVYRAFDRERGLPVALKILREVEPPSVVRFKREFRALAELRHRNLISLYELVHAPPLWLFTMELIDGCDFLFHVFGRSVSQRRPTLPTLREVKGPSVLTPDEPAPLGPESEVRLRNALPQIVSGLRALHRAGYLHRDVKPSNLMVARDGRLVILDAGLVGEVRTQAEDLAGTPQYMAPEQAAGEVLTEACDWYALGAVLYEILAGAPPFSGAKRCVTEAKRRHDAPSLTGRPVPADLAALVDRLLARDPNARPDGEEIAAIVRAPEEEAAAVAAPAVGARLVGRDEEIATLDRALARAEAGESRFVLLAGASGTGKSALCQETARRARTALVLQGRCYPREAMSYKAVDALMDALVRHLRSLPPAEAASLLPEDATALARLFPALRRVSALADREASCAEESGGEPQELRRRAFAALRQLLGSLTARSPVVVIADDLHWADADSADLLAAVLAPPLPPRLMVVAAFRCEDFRGLPFFTRALPTFERLRSANAVEVIRLGELTPTAARELAQRLLGQSSGGDPRRVAEDSGGNPFLIHALAGDRRPPRDPAPAPPLQQHLDRLLREHSLPARRLLEIIAVARAPLPLRVACEAARLWDGRGELLALRAGRLVRSTGLRAADRVEPYHDRIAEALLERLRPRERCARELDLAFAFERRAPEEAELIAHHYERAGRRTHAAHHYLRAAAQAEEALAFNRAASSYRRAIDLGAEPQGGLGALHERLGEALANGGRGPEAAAAFLEAAAQLPSAQSLRCERRAVEQLLISGHLEEGTRRARALLDRAGIAPARSRWGLVAALAWRRGWERIRPPAWRPGRITEPDRARLEIYRTLAHGLAVVEPLRAIEFQDRHLRLALRSGDRREGGAALGARACFLATLGGRHLDRAAKVIDDLRQIRDRDRLLGAWLRTSEAFVAFHRGRFAAAAEIFASAESLLVREVGAVWELATVRMFRLWSLLHAGELARVREDCARELESAASRGDRYVEVTLKRSCANAWMLAGKVEEARRLLKGTDWPSGSGYHLQEWFALKARSELALAERDRGAAAALRDGAFSPLRRSLLWRLAFVRAEALWLRGRLDLAAGGRRIATRAARRLEREETGYASAWSSLLRAGLFAGDPEAKQAALERAARTSGRHGIGLVAAAAAGKADRHQLAILAPGLEH